MFDRFDLLTDDYRATPLFMLLEYKPVLTQHLTLITLPPAPQNALGTDRYVTKVSHATASSPMTPPPPPQKPTLYNTDY